MSEVRGQPIDYTALGYDALRTAMLDIAARTLPEWTDRSEHDLGVLLIELFAHACDITLYYQTRIAAQLFPATSDEPAALVQLARLLGHELRPPAPAIVDLVVGVDAPTDELPLTVPEGTAFETTTGDGERLRFETPHTVVIGDQDLGPVLDGGVRRYAPLPAVAGTTVTDEQTGLSDGGPGQLHPLARAPVIAGTVRVTVTEPAGSTRWHETSALADAAPGDRVFQVQRDASGRTTLLFGDGVNGARPPRGTTQNPVRVLATYRSGGGPGGNVPPGTPFEVSLPGLRDAVAPAGGSGGTPAESLEQARAFAPRLHRAQGRAVTADDHVELALATPGVGKARAVATGWNEIVLHVAPNGRVTEPSELLRRDLLAAFERTRMVGTTLRVLGPEPVDVYLRADVRAEAYFLHSDVKAAVERAVGDLLAFDRVDFGEPLYLSRVYDAAQSLPQVASLTVTQFSRDPRAGVDADGVIDLSPFELARPGYDPPILLTVRGGVER
ncbi:putative baseplate assembly protein [Streptomyces sp. NPDC059010]|uniref:putative baseplate assembly protein n=1 Tax=Streptomyces sp. NPDC059010 TaxID=3346695 RepID=UPI00369A73C8